MTEDDVEIGILRICVAKRKITTSDNQQPKLLPKVVDFLLYLAQFPNQVVSKDQLFQVLWAGRIVEPNALNQVVFQARAALGDTNAEILVTYPKRGLMLVVQERLQSISLRPDNSATTEQPITIISAVANHSKASSKKTFRSLGLMVFMAAISLAAFFAARQQFGTREAQRSALEPSRSQIYCDVFVSRLIDKELAELLAAATRSQRKAICFAIPPELVNAQVAIQELAHSEGLLIATSEGEKFYAVENAVSTALGLIVGNHDREKTFPYIWKQSYQSCLEGLHQTGKTKSSVWQEVLNRVEKDVFSGDAWLDAALLLRLSGNNSTASLLRINALLSSSMPRNYGSMWLNTAIEKSRLYADVQKELSDLRTACDDVQIQADSWMRGACLFERALAEKRAGITNSLQDTLSLAADSFKSTGDVKSAETVKRISKTWFNSSPYNLEGSPIELNDRRVIGTQLLSLLTQNPDLAYETAQKAGLKSWVITDPVARHESMLVMSRAAIASLDKSKLQECANLMEMRYSKNLQTGLQIAGKVALLEVYYAQNRLDMALNIRQKLDIDSKQLRPLMRCRSALIFLETGNRPIIKADADFCLKIRNDRIMYAHFVGMHGWISTIAQERLYGRRSKAIALHDEAANEFEIAANDDSIGNAGGEVAFARQVLFLEAWALQRWDWIGEFCQVKNNCTDPIVQNILTARNNPTQLLPMDIESVEQITVGAPEFLISIYLEQKRIGKCPISAENAALYFNKFRSLGNRVSIQTLEKMTTDCKPGNISASLDAYPERMTY